jgi:hypothetical protein
VRFLALRAFTTCRSSFLSFPFSPFNFPTSCINSTTTAHHRLLDQGQLCEWNLWNRLSIKSRRPHLLSATFSLIPSSVRLQMPKNSNKRSNPGAASSSSTSTTTAKRQQKTATLSSNAAPLVPASSSTPYPPLSPRGGYPSPSMSAYHYPPPGQQPSVEPYGTPAVSSTQTPSISLPPIRDVATSTSQPDQLLSPTAPSVQPTLQIRQEHQLQQQILPQQQQQQQQNSQFQRQILAQINPQVTAQMTQMNYSSMPTLEQQQAMQDYLRALGVPVQPGIPPPPTLMGLFPHRLHRKEIKRRTKTGCLTCRKRRIKVSQNVIRFLGDTLNRRATSPSFFLDCPSDTPTSPCFQIFTDSLASESCFHLL